MPEMKVQLSFFDQLFGFREPPKPAREELKPVIARRAYQRSMKLHVLTNGSVKVTAGKSVPQKLIMRFVEANRDWIERQQQRMAKWREQFPAKKYQTGEAFVFAGQDLRLAVRSASGRGAVYLEGENMVLEISPDSIDQAATKIRRFYEKAGRAKLAELVQIWSEKMQLFPTGVSYRSQKSRWGSCSSRGRVSLNWRLSVFAHEVAEYVVIHELAHLKHPNHSKSFWQLVEVHCPNYRKYRDHLNKHHMQAEFLSEAK